MTLVVIWGTRPEAIKLGPVVAALRARGLSPQLLCTGQHTDLLAGTPAETDLADGQSLGLASAGTVMAWLAAAASPLEQRLRALGPSLVVVQGDTMSALAGARAAEALGLPIAHVEAGIRSGALTDPWPEEGFRREITQLATWHYTPTSHTAANLRREGSALTQVRLTGNPVVSALARYADARPRPASTLLTVLVTLHRRELLRSPDLGAVLQALAFAMAHADHLQFLWPLHPAMTAVLHTVTWPANVRFSTPLPYRTCVETLSRCAGVLTDSGGLQEEAATLGVPCVVLRHVTDRPESVIAGVCRTIPPLPPCMDDAVATLERLPRTPTPCFGTPSAAAWIADHLVLLASLPHRAHAQRA